MPEALDEQRQEEELALQPWPWKGWVPGMMEP